jgi:hypothetical protein
VGLLLNYSISSGDAPILRLRLAVRRASYLRSCKSPGAAEAKGAATPDAASRETPLPLGGMRPPQAGFGRLAVGALFVLRQSPRRYSPRRRLGRPVGLRRRQGVGTSAWPRPDEPITAATRCPNALERARGRKRSEGARSSRFCRENVYWPPPPDSSRQTAGAVWRD